MFGVKPPMPNGVRNSIWAVFFLAGMVFMATLIFMVRPELFSATGVREMPGSSIVLSASPSQSEASTRDEIDTIAQTTAPTDGERAIASTPTQKSEPISVDKKSLPTPEPLAEEQPNSGATRQTSTSIEKAYSPVQMIRRMRPGRSVVGHVILLGDIPPPKTLAVADGFCGPHSTATNFVSKVFVRASDNSLADVVVFLANHELETRRWIAPPQQPVITQRGCQFEPYVTAIQLGQTVAFENLDPVLHNVHARPTASRNREVNLAQMPKGRPIIVEFKERELFVRVECNVHPYMVSYICIMDTPFFAVTKEDGRFHFQNVPPGEYTVTAVHRRAGMIQQQARVSDEESPEFEFTFKAPREIAQIE